MKDTKEWEVAHILKGAVLLAADGKTEVDANLVTMLSKDEVVRHISQVFCLERLAASDIPMARSLLSALVQVWLPWKSHQLMD